METLLISACLAGVRCRYDGGGKALPELKELQARYQLLPLCPEQLGGLPTPRPPAERRGERVVTREGGDVTQAFQRGAAETLALAQRFGCRKALLKERSPSCGGGTIYDGAFTGGLKAGDGLTAQALKAAGVRVYGESELDALLGQSRLDVAEE